MVCAGFAVNEVVVDVVGGVVDDCVANGFGLVVELVCAGFAVNELVGGVVDDCEENGFGFAANGLDLLEDHRFKEPHILVFLKYVKSMQKLTYIEIRLFIHSN